jgi:hypothetical protein
MLVLSLKLNTMVFAVGKTMNTSMISRAADR